MLRGLQSLGLKLDSRETRRLMQLADADGSGALDVREFAQVEISYKIAMTIDYQTDL